MYMKCELCAEYVLGAEGESSDARALTCLTFKNTAGDRAGLCEGGRQRHEKLVRCVPLPRPMCVTLCEAVSKGVPTYRVGLPSEKK